MKKRIAFKTCYRFYEYQIVLFELINVFVEEQKFMNDMFRDIFDNYVILYLDDIFIYSNETFEDYK